LNRRPFGSRLSELVVGRTLREILAAGPLLKRTLAIAGQVADGLAKAQQRGSCIGT